MKLFGRVFTTNSGNRNRPRRKSARLDRRHPRFEQLEDRRVLATIVVTSLADVVAGDGQVTLREAIQAAEMDASVDGSAKGSGADVIEFHSSLSGVSHLTTIGDSSAGPSAFKITTAVTIRGNASGITLARSIVGPEMRFFHVTDTGQLTLESISVASGIARGAEGTVGDPNGKDGRGGAILNEGRLTVVASTFYQNLASGGAAALAGFHGAGRGGAIFNEGGIVTITNTTISDNRARDHEGTFDKQAFGGGVFSRNGLLTIHHSTIVDNTSTAGRGVYVIGEGPDKSSSLSLSNSIVGNNGPIEEYTDVVVTYDNGGVVASEGVSNLIRREVNFDGAIVSKAAPNLGPLGANGGPTWTHAVLPGSPALDSGTAGMLAGQAGVPLVDQRGGAYARVADGDGLLGARIDIGAFELQGGISTPDLTGDFNLDGIVDAADYTIWRRQLNQSVAPYSGADGDGSGKVDSADYLLWKANFGKTGGTAGAAAISAALALESTSAGAHPWSNLVPLATAGDTSGDASARQVLSNETASRALSTVDLSLLEVLASASLRHDQPAPLAVPALESTSPDASDDAASNDSLDAIRSPWANGLRD